MKMALRKNHKPAIWISIAIILITLGCNIPGLFQNSSPEAETQPEIPTQDTELQPENPTLEATFQAMLATPSSPSENNNEADCLPEIFPGKTTKAEVTALLGDPAAIQQDGGHEALQYASSLRGQYNTVYFQNQVVDWVSLVLAEDNPLTWSAVKTQYGEPAHTAYSDYLQGSQIYAFPEQGLNFTADDKLDIVFIQECFVPMSLEDYMKVYGDFLLQNDPFRK